MRGLLSETVNHKLSAEGVILWVPTLIQVTRTRYATRYSPSTFAAVRSTASAMPKVAASMFAECTA